MLEAIRKRSASLVVKLLFGLLILSFAVWGIGDTIRGTVANQPAASVGDIDIPPRVLQQEYQREASRVRQALGGEVSIDQLRAMGLGQRVLDRLVTRMLLLQGADDLRLAVSDQTVRNEITTMPAFQGPLGKFDRDRFHQLLYSSGLTEDQFVNDLRQDLVRAQYLGSLTAIGALPDAAVVPFFKYGEQRRVVEMIRFGDDGTAAPGEPDAATLAKFHQDNAARFTAPELRAVTYVLLRAKDLTDEVTVTPEELQRAYDNRSEEFVKPERRTLQQMVLSDEATAKQAHGRLMEGGDFTAVAKEVAGTDAKALELGTLTHADLPEELANAAFQLPNGGISTPVQTGLGWHILRVTKIDRGSKATLEEATPRLKAELAREKAVDALYDLSNRLEDSLGGGATLEEAAASLNLPLRKVAAVDAKGNDADGQPVKDLPAPDRFLPAAFDLQQGQDSVLTETGDDGYFIVRVDGITPPALRPLDSIRNEVIVAWQRARRADASREMADKALDKAKAGTPMDEIAKETGQEVAVSSPFSRDGTDAPADASRDVIKAVFDLKQGEAAVVRGDDATFLVRVKEIKEADPATAKAQVDELRGKVANAMRNDLMAQLTNGLRERFPVTINRQVAEQVF